MKNFIFISGISVVWADVPVILTTFQTTVNNLMNYATNGNPQNSFFYNFLGSNSNSSLNVWNNIVVDNVMTNSLITDPLQLSSTFQNSPLLTSVGETIYSFVPPPIVNLTTQSTDQILLESAEQDSTSFDYIVVGSGAAGGVIASRLAETYSKASVLVLERGPERPPQSMSESTIAQAILNPAISEEFFTPEGVRLNVAKVLGGGPSINGGLYLQEDSTWLDRINEDLKRRGIDTPGLDPIIVNEAYSWLQQSGLFCDNRNGFWAKVRRVANLHVGFVPNIPEKSWSIRTGTFGTKTIFCGGTRLSMDNLMRRWNNITIKTQATVSRIVFSAGPGVFDALEAVQNKQITASDLLSRGLEASCVDYDSDTPVQTGSSITGTLFNQVINPIANVGTIGLGLAGLGSATALLDNSPPPSSTTGGIYYNPSGGAKKRRVCIKPGGRIILSGGTIQSPAALIRSGVGPTSQTATIGVPNLMTNNQIGENLSDHMAFGLMVYNNTLLPQTGEAALTTQQVYSTMQLGRDCKPGIGSYPDPSVPGCQTILTEELSGGKMPLLYLIATLQRFSKINPADPILTEGVNSLRDCIVNDYCAPFLDPFFKCLDKGLMISTFLSQPKSRGSVTVDKKGRPVVDCGYLSNKDDVLVARASVKKLIEIIQTDAVRDVVQKNGASCGDVINNFFYSPLNYGFTGYSRPFSELTFSTSLIQKGVTEPYERPAVTPPIGPYPVPDDRIDELHRTHFNTIWHYTGTDSIGTVTDHLNEFQLIQVPGQPTVSRLSICDASVLPIVSRVNSMASAMMIGYYCAYEIAKKDAAIRNNNYSALRNSDLTVVKPPVGSSFVSTILNSQQDSSASLNSNNARRLDQQPRNNLRN